MPGGPCYSRPSLTASGLLGEQFSIADIICAKVLSIACDYQLDMQDDAVSAYIRRALERPAHKRADAIGRESAPPER